MFWQLIWSHGEVAGENAAIGRLVPVGLAGKNAAALDTGKRQSKRL